MGSITRGLSNNITTGGVILPAGITNASVSAVTSFANAANPANLVLISTQTASASATISFTTGLNSTYDEYIFKFINIHPSVDSVSFLFNMSTDGGSNYNVTKTTTNFYSYHFESDAGDGIGYYGANDLAQSTAFQPLNVGIGADDDQNCSGFLTLFNPASTTYVKHFISRVNEIFEDNGSQENYVAGYGNTTSAVNAVQFKFSSGNIDDGIIKMYGVKKS
jgi:hypothetical protein